MQTVAALVHIRLAIWWQTSIVSPLVRFVISRFELATSPDEMLMKHCLRAGLRTSDLPWDASDIFVSGPLLPLPRVRRPLVVQAHRVCVPRSGHPQQSTSSAS